MKRPGAQGVVRKGSGCESLCASASLHIDVTVEGVETTEQAARVRALGCTEMQGYMFGRPMPARETERLITISAGVYNAA